MSKSARCDPGAARLSARRDICQRGVNGWEIESHGSLRGKARGTGVPDLDAHDCASPTPSPARLGIRRQKQSPIGTRARVLLKSCVRRSLETCLADL